MKANITHTFQPKAIVFTALSAILGMTTLGMTTLTGCASHIPTSRAVITDAHSQPVNVQSEQDIYGQYLLASHNLSSNSSSNPSSKKKTTNNQHAQNIRPSLTIQVDKTDESPSATPNQQIFISIQRAPTLPRTTTTNSNALCEYQGTADLMGQDALHGMIYTIPLSKINNAEGQLFLRFKESVLTVDSNNPDVLNSLCAEGVFLKGDYIRR